MLNALKCTTLCSYGSSSFTRVSFVGILPRNEHVFTLPLTAEIEATGQQQGLLPDASADVEVGGDGGSRAWVGDVRRTTREKSVIKVDHGNGGVLRSFRSSALDDKVEWL